MYFLLQLFNYFLHLTHTCTHTRIIQIFGRSIINVVYQLFYILHILYYILCYILYIIQQIQIQNIYKILYILQYANFIKSKRLWLVMTILGHTSPHSAILDHTWSYLAILGHIWTCGVILGDICHNGPYLAILIILAKIF